MLNLDFLNLALSDNNLLPKNVESESVTVEKNVIKIVLNRFTIVDSKDTNVAEKIADKIVNLLKLNVNHNRVKRENLELYLNDCNTLIIDTKPVKNGLVIPAKMNRKKTEFLREPSGDIRNSAIVNNRSETELLYRDPLSSEFTIDDLYQIKGIVKCKENNISQNKTVILFSTIGDIIPDGEYTHKIYRRGLKPLNYQDKVTVGYTIQTNKIPSFCRLCSVESGSVVISVTIHNYGRVSFSYGNYRFDLAVIGKHNVNQNRLVDLTDLELAQYFNSEGVTKNVKGTKTINTDHFRYKISEKLLDQTYGQYWKLVPENDIIFLEYKINGIKKQIPLMRDIDQGFHTIPRLLPVNTGILPDNEICNILSQVKTSLMRLVNIYNDSGNDKTMIKLTKNLFKTFCQNYETLKPEYNLDDKTQTQLNDIFTHSHRVYGFTFLKDLTIKCKIALKDKDSQSIDLKQFISIVNGNFI